MEIGGLGLINTITSVNKSKSNEPNSSGFTGIIGGLMTNPSENRIIEQNANQLQEEEAKELLHFLQIEDILHIEGGLQLLQDAMAADEKQLFSLIEGFINGETDLRELFTTGKDHLEGLAHLSLNDPESLLTVQGRISVEQPNLKNEELAAILLHMNSLPIKDLRNALNGEMKELVKAIKMFELLGERSNSLMNSSQLKELLQQLTNKLEHILEGKGSEVLTSRQATRLEYLQKTFSAVATEVNTASSKSNGEAPIQKSEFMNGFLPFQQTSKVEQFTLTLNQKGKATSSADLIKQFENILARSQFSNVAGTQKLLIKLHPEHLGALRIELLQRDAGLVAKIMTTTQVAKDTLESHLNNLKQAFGSQNIQVDRVEVSQQLSYQERFLGREQQQPQEQGREKQNQEKQDDHNGAEELTFNASLEEALVNKEV